MHRWPKAPLPDSEALIVWHETLQVIVEQGVDVSEVPSIHMRPQAKPKGKFIDLAISRNEETYQAYLSWAYPVKAISDNLGLHHSMLSKVIKTYDYSRPGLH
jgi:hypothetical protein